MAVFLFLEGGGAPGSRNQLVQLPWQGDQRNFGGTKGMLLYFRKPRFTMKWKWGALNTVLILPNTLFCPLNDDHQGIERDQARGWKNKGKSNLHCDSHSQDGSTSISWRDHTLFSERKLLPIECWPEPKLWHCSPNNFPAIMIVPPPCSSFIFDRKAMCLGVSGRCLGIELCLGVCWRGFLNTGLSGRAIQHFLSLGRGCVFLKISRGCIMLSASPQALSSL